jgi:hypothetical protein
METESKSTAADAARHPNHERPARSAGARYHANIGWSAEEALSYIQAKSKSLDLCQTVTSAGARSSKLTFCIPVRIDATVMKAVFSIAA